MASGTYYPAASGDDGYWDSNGFFGDNDYLVIGKSTVSRHSFVRFPSVTIPQGSIVSEAYIRFTAQDTDSSTVVNANIYFNNVDNAVAPTSIGEGDGLALTSAVAWSAIAAWTNDTQYNTPELKTILQTVIDRGSWSSNNAIQIVIKNNGSSGSARRLPSSFELLGGAEKAELHVTWALSGEITDGVGMADTYASVVLAEIIAEAFGMSDTYDLDSPYREITDGCGIDDTLARSFETFNSITNGAGMADVMAGIFEIFVTITNNTGMADTYARFIETNKSIQDDLGSADLHEAITLYSKTIAEIFSSWDTLKWGWRKSIADSLNITETVAKILGIPVKDWITLKDTQIDNWSGVEAVSDSFYAIDIAKAIRVYDDSIADGMAITDAVKLFLELMITDILTCVDTGTSVWKGIRSVDSTFGISDAIALKKVFDDLVADGMAIVDAVKLFFGLVITDALKATDSLQNIGNFRHSAEETITLADIVSRAFPKSISDSLAIADTSLIDFLTLLQVTDTFNIAETSTPGLTISQTIADVLEALDTATIQQLLQELIQDGLNIEVIIELDDELWQTWVLNTGAFHPSVYSGYDYNSFAVFNDTVYGCKSDGIYELAGDTDDGTAFKPGIILPSTQFGSSHNKRFRKGFLGVSGDNVVVKAETENGWRTFRVTDTEVSITRDLKGRSWKFSVEGFDSLDSIDLIPVILSRR
jgi:hypothetical protein